MISYSGIMAFFVQLQPPHFFTKSNCAAFQTANKTPVTTEASNKKYQGAVVVKSQKDLQQKIQDGATKHIMAGIYCGSIGKTS